jgi:hypothetical integral membrane protein (TIGR02206 family)
MNVPFHAFDTQHLLTLAVIGCSCFCVARLSYLLPSSSRKWLGRGLGLFLLSYVIIFYLQVVVGYAFSWRDSLPLELCNLALMTCIISLFRPNRLTKEITYFFGLGGVLQATLTPDLSRGFPSWDFILFFWAHGGTLISISFLVAAREFRPLKGSIFRMMIMLNCYAMFVGAIDAAFGWNYGYLCRKPGKASLLDFLGPWPWYLISLEFVSFLIFLLLYLPWTFRRNTSETGA